MLTFDTEFGRVSLAWVHITINQLPMNHWLSVDVMCSLPVDHCVSCTEID